MIWAGGVAAQTKLRIASFTTEMSGRGPGLLLRDLQAGKLAQFDLIMDQIIAVDADILVLQDVDWDARRRVVTTLQEIFESKGLDFPHSFAPRPNTGIPTGIDVDQNGRTNEPRDAQGYGWFRGQGGIAVFSKFPVDAAGALEFSDILWRDVPGSRSLDAGPLADVQRLSSVAHFALPVRVNGQVITLLSAHATPPVFDGPEDRNGRRNADEVLFWGHYLDGAFGPVPALPIIVGNLNLDPDQGEGLHAAIQHLLALPQLQDPAPLRQPTAQFSFGALRLSYILPSRQITVTRGGIDTPIPDATRHRLIWLDLELPE